MLTVMVAAWLAALASAVPVAAAAPALASPPADVVGWRAARWGMTEAELEKAFGARLKRLAAPLHYGGAYARDMLPGVKIAGEHFTAFFQMNARSHRLQQVLLEHDRRRITPAGYLRLVDALEARYGEGQICVPASAGGASKIVELVWRFPTTTVHASMIDLQSPNLLYEDPNTDLDVLQPSYERRRIVRRFLPRRIVVRLHPSGRKDLISEGRCFERKPARPGPKQNGPGR
jgi:hypothetical protein